MNDDTTVGVSCHMRTCIVCGNAFAAARPQAPYCSAACKRAVLLQRGTSGMAAQVAPRLRRFNDRAGGRATGRGRGTDMTGVNMGKVGKM